MSEEGDYKRDLQIDKAVDALEALLRPTAVVFVYRVYDTVTESFCSSGRSMYSTNGRSVWMSMNGATQAKNAMSSAGDKEIQRFRLVRDETDQ